MTLPIQTPSIGVTGVVQQPTIAEQLAPLFQGLQAAAELKDRKIKQAQAEHERQIREHVGGTVLQFMQSSLESQAPGQAPDPYAQALQSLQGMPEAVGPFVEATAAPRAAADERRVQASAFRVFQDNLTTAGTDPTKWAMVIQRVKDPRVGSLLMGNIEKLVQVAGSAASGRGQELANVGAEKSVADDRAIAALVPDLGGLSSWTPQTVGRVAARAMAINPQKGLQFAEGLTKLLPGYTMVQNPNGSVSYVASQPGGGVRGAPLQPKPGDADQRRAAGFSRRVFESNATMTDLERQYPGISQDADDLIRAIQSKGGLPVVGRYLETLAAPAITRWKLRNPNVPAPTKDAFREYINSRLDLGNAILRKVSGATINLEELARETQPYVSMLGASEAIVRATQERRLQLALQFADEAGVEFNPNRLTPRAKRYYLRALLGAREPDLSGADTTATRIGGPNPLAMPPAPPGTTYVPRH